MAGLWRLPFVDGRCGRAVWTFMYVSRVRVCVRRSHLVIIIIYLPRSLSLGACLPVCVCLSVCVCAISVSVCVSVLSRVVLCCVVLCGVG